MTITAKGKFAKEGKRPGAVCLISDFPCRKQAEVYLLPVKCTTSFPLGMLFVPTNPTIARGIVNSLISVSMVLRWSAITQVSASIIQAITIPVVHMIRRCFANNKSVHEHLFSIMIWATNRIEGLGIFGPDSAPVDIFASSVIARVNDSHLTLGERYKPDRLVIWLNDSLTLNWRSACPHGEPSRGNAFNIAGWDS